MRYYDAGPACQAQSILKLSVLFFQKGEDGLIIWDPAIRAGEKMNHIAF
jgi:hypothetical protein